MNEQTNIFQFLSSKHIDYANCPIEVLLEQVEQYDQKVEDQQFFSAQMLLLSQSIEENRNGMDAMRLGMKVLELVSPALVKDSFVGHAKSDNRKI